MYCPTMPGVMPTSSTPCPFDPGQEPPHRRLIRLLRVRIVMLGIEEFIPGEACRPPCPLDQLRQDRLAAGRWNRVLADALNQLASASASIPESDSIDALLIFQMSYTTLLAHLRSAVSTGSTAS